MNVNVLLNELFTVNSLKKILTNKNYTTFQKTAHKIVEINNGMTNFEILSAIYKFMSKKHRNEYFYKNTLFNKILLGQHSVNTTTAIRELPVAGNILDFLIVNGSGQVYEIKTELDNLKRLEGQINAYYKAFSFCNIVTNEDDIEGTMSHVSRPEVGIIVLTKRNTLHVEREPVKYDGGLEYEAMFKILRKYEFEDILKTHFGELPKANSFEYYTVCFDMFKKIEITLAQSYMLKQLKKRYTITKNQVHEFNKVPMELKSLVYFSEYKKRDFEQLNHFLYKTDMEA
ncbi:hypothetical protein JCM15457_1765 [Liquorilactobacillus sucicola DSM 21376 = JCM 15457]|uniref:Sce7726 family protein n=1 Tax=Liquorilactobacillus sucicola DSM 21376 = JCM 15457 TaxID=1423806 RepID=A0A023CZ82_9LACO|nr:sce7726 family protein [Liquorilactobacillus sucicola]KRN07555.1 hypothetical protein FD15_GL000841 [Liquorilactobacillus sucicola DSM 21376 = JCM 15457]GAJ26815.1 hypothetical protein JCM15457_1765 [Liquorilactobacillus sucicola DSM 21376 = JCM 15457]